MTRDILEPILFGLILGGVLTPFVLRANYNKLTRFHGVLALWTFVSLIAAAPLSKAGEIAGKVAITVSIVLLTTGVLLTLGPHLRSLPKRRERFLMRVFLALTVLAMCWIVLILWDFEIVRQFYGVDWKKPS
jgi:hypothetical protein